MMAVRPLFGRGGFCTGSATITASRTAAPLAVETVTDSAAADAGTAATARTEQAVTYRPTMTLLACIACSIRVSTLGQLQASIAHSDRPPGGNGTGCDGRTGVGVPQSQHAEPIGPAIACDPRDARSDTQRARAPAQFGGRRAGGRFRVSRGGRKSGSAHDCLGAAQSGAARQGGPGHP